MASCSPVEAPEGTAARPNAPEARRTSTSTVGLPRESMISRAVMAVMVVFIGKERGSREREELRRRGCSKGTRAGEGKAKVRLGSRYARNAQRLTFNAQVGSGL